MFKEELLQEKKDQATAQPLLQKQAAVTTETAGKQEAKEDKLDAFTSNDPTFDKVLGTGDGKEKPGPYLVYTVDLATGEMTSNKHWEFRPGEMAIQVWVKRTGKTTTSTTKYWTNDDTQLGKITLSATEKTTLHNTLYKQLSPDIKRQKTLEKEDVATGLKIKPGKCTYPFEKVEERKMYNSRQYFEEVGLPFYLKMRKAEDIKINDATIQKKVWDIKGAVFALCLSANETGYANESSFNTAKKKGNYWGVGGASNFQNIGDSFDTAYNYWIDFLSKGYLKNGKRDGRGWPEFIQLMESGDFTADKLNKALHSGRHKPTSTEKSAGNYPYNADPNKATDTYFKDSTKKEAAEYTNYAGKIISPDIMKMVIGRFVVFLDEKIANPGSLFNNDPVTEKAERDYKVGLYETIKFELADFMKNDYPSLSKTKDDYDAG